MIKQDQIKEVECKSIYDLAAITGVSYATVSRVLNNRGRTAEATRKIVLNAAAKYNFKPKMKARRQTIGIVMWLDRMLKKDFYGYADTMLMHLLNALSIKGYSIEFFSSHNIATLHNCLLDGVICCSWSEQIEDAMKRMPNMPVVLINGGPAPNCSRVYSNHEQSGRMAAKYLIEKGHKKAGIILDSRIWGNQLRADGFRQVFEEKGMPLDPVMEGFLREQTETIMIKNMLSAGASAFFLAGEDTILQLNSTLQLLNDHEKNPLTIISMENSSLSRYLNPPMTTIAQPFDDIVKKTIELIDSQLERGKNHPQEIKLDNTLIIRNNDLYQPAR